MKEKKINSIPGIPVLILGVIAVPLGLIMAIISLVAIEDSGQFNPVFIAWFSFAALGIFSFIGLYMVEPKQSVVLSLFGKYAGTTHATGLRFNNPFFTKKKVSQRVRNFESGHMKVNDLGGSPIEIAAIVVWEVQDSAEAVFNVDDYESFVQIQSESAIRAMASIYPYDPEEKNAVALRSHPAEVSERMKSEIQDRLTKAGITVIEARISHLAYAPEIAQAMLQRQQAGAIIAARSRIVEGAVSMVDSALESLKEKGVVNLDEERKAAMVSNLLVVLCSNGTTQPVVNTGSIY